VTLEDLDIEIHLVKENQIVSNDAKSQTKFMHGINLVLARNYSDNLKEEVKKYAGEDPAGHFRAMHRLATAATKQSG
jgi:hypothetical protein